MAATRDESGEFGDRLASLEQRFAAFEVLTARVAQLEALVSRLVAGSEMHTAGTIVAVPNEPPRPPALPSDDPFADPGWVEGPEGVFTYSVEMDCCQHCGLMSFQQLNKRTGEIEQVKAIRPNGGKKHPYKDINQRKFEIYQKEYVCLDGMCGKSSRQYIPCLGHSLLPRRRMTSRLFSSIIEELLSDTRRRTYEEISLETELSVATLGRWSKKFKGIPRHSWR